MQLSANPLFLKAFSIWCRRIVFFAVVLVTAAGCAVLGGGPKSPAPDVGGFVVKGRMAVRNGNDGFTSSFLWRHASARDEIDLWGPLGQGHSRLVRDATEVTVYTAKGELYRDRDADAAMQRWLGFALPMRALTHWIRGEQAPGYPVEYLTFGDSGELTALDQLSWRLEFSSYQVFDAGPRLPSRIVAVHGDVKVTLLPAEWSFGLENTFDTL
jgi:outer membrane lipoprotein LolB